MVDISVYMAIGCDHHGFLALVVSKATVKILAVKNDPDAHRVCTAVLVGAFVISNSVSTSIWSSFFGVVGLLLRGMSYPAAPFLLGIILGPMADNGLRRALILSGRSDTILYSADQHDLCWRDHPDGADSNSMPSAG